MPTLELDVSRAGEPHRLRFDGAAPITIGTAPDAVVALPPDDPDAHPQSAVITFVAGAGFVLSARGATTLNDRLFLGERALAPGDRLGFGRTTIVVAARDADDAPIDLLAVRVERELAAFRQDLAQNVFTELSTTFPDAVAERGVDVGAVRDLIDRLAARPDATRAEGDALAERALEELLGITVEPRPSVTDAAGLAALSGEARFGGDVVLRGLTLDDAALAALAALEQVDGDLVLDGCGGFEALELPRLAHVGRLFAVRGAEDLARIALPALRTAAELSLVELPALTALSLPALTTLTGGARLFRCHALREAALPALVAVGSDVGVADCAAFEALRAPALASSGGHVRFVGTPALARVEVGALRVVGGDIGVRDAPALERLALPALERVDGALTFLAVPRLAALDAPALEAIGGQVGLAGPSALAAVSWPRLRHVAGRVVLGSLDALAAIDLPRLERVGDGLVLNTLPALARLRVDRLTALGRLGIRGCPRLPDGDVRRVVMTLYSAGFAGQIAVDREATEVLEGASDSRDATITLDHDLLLGDRDIDMEGFPARLRVGGHLAAMRAASPERLALLDRVTEVTGDLLVTQNGVDVAEIVFRGLWRVGGSVSAGLEGQLRRLGLPALERVGRALTLGGATALEAVDLGALEEVEGDLTFARLLALGQLALPRLARVGGRVLIGGLPSLEEVALPSLVAATAVRVAQCP
ncbi:MAG: hypothetical protein H6745_33845, partial [Deltaproteobacteria bacterium]|nr:hypothetical protein [Deltaproteobacteria bacterium]